MSKENPIKNVLRAMFIVPTLCLYLFSTYVLITESENRVVYKTGTIIYKEDDLALAKRYSYMTHRVVVDVAGVKQSMTLPLEDFIQYKIGDSITVEEKHINYTVLGPAIIYILIGGISNFVIIGLSLILLIIYTFFE